jgi:V/A-type H+-transporting ATPase subunit E
MSESGVQELIARLRDEGVKAGEVKASQLLNDAEKKAADMLKKAKKEAEEMLASARAEIESEKAAARESLQIAVRDAVLSLKEQLTVRFAAHVKRLVAAELADKDFLKKLILTIAGRSVPETIKDQSLQVLLSDEFSADPSKHKTIDPLVLSLSKDLFREGITLHTSGERTGGIRVHLKGEDLEIDLTEKTLADSILRYLVPRFRSVIEGEG